MLQALKIKFVFTILGWWKYFFVPDNFGGHSQGGERKSGKNGGKRKWRAKETRLQIW